VEACAAALDALAPGGRLVIVTWPLEGSEYDGGGDEGDSARGGVRRAVPDRGAHPSAIAGAMDADGVVRVLPGPSNDGFTAIAVERDVEAAASRAASPVAR
jgi:hypothetical protein